ncbi:MAG: hypothetical protein JJV92_09505 [Desulfosarcina sp.]|nr:hypothetical protein [Desulfobacterales bacterium]
MKKFLFFLYIFLTVPGIIGISGGFSYIDKYVSVSEPMLMLTIGLSLIFLAGTKRKKKN